MNFISTAYAQTAGAPAEPGLLANLFPFFIIIFIFYFLVIRPQQKKLKEHGNMVNDLKKGDKIVTGGGIIGKINKIDADSMIAKVDIADKVTVEINKNTITEVLESKPESSVKKATKKSKK